MTIIEFEKFKMADPRCSKQLLFCTKEVYQNIKNVFMIFQQIYPAILKFSNEIFKILISESERVDNFTSEKCYCLLLFFWIIF